MELPLDGDLVMCAPEGGRAYVLNAAATLVWELCDGTRTVEAIAREMATAYAIGHQQAVGDVQGFLADLREASLVT